MPTALASLETSSDHLLADRAQWRHQTEMSTLNRDVTCGCVCAYLTSCICRDHNADDADTYIVQVYVCRKWLSFNVVTRSEVQISINKPCHVQDVQYVFQTALPELINFSSIISQFFYQRESKDPLTCSSQVHAHGGASYYPGAIKHMGLKFIK